MSKHWPKGAALSVAVIGYGSQGRAIALNLQDSGHHVTVGLRSRSGSRRKAKRDGIANVTSISDAVAVADIITFAIPDHVHGSCFKDQVLPVLSDKPTRGSSRRPTTLWFLHGLSVHFGYLVPPADCDVILIAPHAPGPAVREAYLGDRSVSAFYAVHQGNQARAKRTTSALAEGIGVQRRRLLSTTFEQEALGDMFGEQAVLCGGLAALIKAGHDTLVAKGHDPEHAYLEVTYQLDLIVELIKRHGISGMFSHISVAAQLGSLETGPKLIDTRTRQRMDKTYDEIASGRFARRLERLSDRDLARLSDQLQALTSVDLEKAARKFGK